MIGKPALLLAALLGLSACVETSAPAATTGPVGPGPMAAEAFTAAALFDQVCLSTMPDLAKARGVLSAGPYRQDSRSGIYYHNSYDLSFKVRTEAGTPVCSVVSGTDGDANRFASAIRALPPRKGVAVDLGIPHAAAGRIYVSAFAMAE